MFQDSQMDLIKTKVAEAKVSGILFSGGRQAPKTKTLQELKQNSWSNLNRKVCMDRDGGCMTNTPSFPPKSQSSARPSNISVNHVVALTRVHNWFRGDLWCCPDGCRVARIAFKDYFSSLVLKYHLSYNNKYLKSVVIICSNALICNNEGKWLWGNWKRGN